MNRFKTILILLISFLLQSTVLSKIDIFGANINLMLPLIVCLSQVLGTRTAANSGLVFGLLQDLMFSNIIGVRALSYYLIGTFVGNERFRIASKDIRSGLILTFVITFVNFIFVGLITFIFNNDFSIISNYVFVPIFAEAVLNTIFYLVYHKLLTKVMYIPSYRI